ncbi:bifunctional 3,4-dihydroxy-2-butanone-4-phosphate synthase/GTP cyclohydrolase II [Paraferrimonas sp. SM1919]|uniref:bifunctional 3,4-dihydroxy-2-butanone-4-phosphate synthase/GTP cyclohydrolase II n=1 Tax=Paraferrimonas sp. SM1919 TaxID=2662263 RepID=UPI0013D804AF|nr:bifunctional 3,4-dihydroxy-2-butanone-4-phosphate synthase/GTP cyclohydrolase II [Paraferrimonas sp. SM1919]
MSLNTPEEIIEDIRQGKMVILMDDEDRENEGDLIIAAEKITPQAINFMATYGRGLICLTLTKDRCEQLKLPLMVDNNGAAFSTNFTVSIEAAEGVTTGISAADRATTVLAAVKKDAKAEDIVQPGHIFPLKAQDGGVLIRAGHTEAGCDLPRLAGLEPAGVIVEILKEDGTMARRPDLEIFAKEHGLKMGTIADLIEYRNLNETTIVREASCKMPTRYGEFDMHCFRDTIDNQLHFAMVNGSLEGEPLVRVHLHNAFNDLIFSERDQNRSWPLDHALERVGKDGGVVVILASDTSNDALLNKMKSFAAIDAGEQPQRKKAKAPTSRIGVGSQILADLGVNKMRLLSEPKRYHSLGGFGLEVVEYISDKN